MSNPDETKCPGNCFRPVGMAWDKSGRLFVTSDTTGELYVLQKLTDKPTATTSGTIVTATGDSGAMGWRASGGAVMGVAALVGAMMV